MLLGYLKKNFDKWQSERVSSLLTGMPDALALAGKNLGGTFLDFGCGQGYWCLGAAPLFRTVYGIDISEASLAHARQVAKDRGFDNTRFLGIDAAEEVGSIDFMVCVMVIELARSSEVADIFDFAGRHLSSGGRFLCCSRRPVGFLRSLLMLERFLIEGTWRAVRRYLALARSAAEAVLMPEIKRIPRARFYHTPRGIIGLAERSGLKLVKSPDELGRVEGFRLIDKHITRPFPGLRQVDWFLFEKG